MTKRIVLVGAGHAHLHVLAGARALTDAGHTVTLVSPGRFWYSGMGPGVLSGRYSADDDTVDVGRLVERAGGRHVDARVAALDADARVLTLENGTPLGWDLLSLNVGSDVPLDAIPGAAEHATPVKPVSNFAKLRGRWLDASGAPVRSVVVIGGGAAGCESALAAARVFEDRAAILAPTRAAHGTPGASSSIPGATDETPATATIGPARVTLVAGAEGVLDGWPERARRIVRQVCAARGIALVEGRRVTRIEGNSCALDDGRVLPCDDAVVATGVVPNPLIGASSLAADADGAMIVDETLRSVSHPHVLGGGDCVALRDRPLARVGVYAVRQAPMLLGNLLALADGRDPGPFEPQAHYLLILNLSDGTGLLSWRGLAMRGRLVFRLKEWLDRRFVARYRT